MITRLLVALFALYLVAGPSKPGDSQADAASSLSPTQPALAARALDFCLTHRDSCANLVSGMTASPARTGTLAAAAPAPGPEQALPVAAPDLPLPPRRPKAARPGA